MRIDWNAFSVCMTRGEDVGGGTRTRDWRFRGSASCHSAMRLQPGYGACPALSLFAASFAPTIFRPVAVRRPTPFSDRSHSAGVQFATVNSYATLSPLQGGSAGALHSIGAFPLTGGWIQGVWAVSAAGDFCLSGGSNRHSNTPRTSALPATPTCYCLELCVFLSAALNGGRHLTSSMAHSPHDRWG